MLPLIEEVEFSPVMETLMGARLSILSFHDIHLIYNVYYIHAIYIHIPIVGFVDKIEENLDYIYIYILHLY